MSVVRDQPIHTRDVEYSSFTPDSERPDSSSGGMDSHNMRLADRSMSEQRPSSQPPPPRR
ncbi:hypothetical protein VTH82DRAFT_428 [Thermothelomyces myriococcoides]